MEGSNLLGMLFSQVAIYIVLRYDLVPWQYLCDHKVIYFESDTTGKEKKNSDIEAYQYEVIRAG